MNKKMSDLVSSTPHPDKNRPFRTFFEDVVFSPIAEPFQSKPAPSKARSKPTGAQRVGAVRKRKVASKEKAAPETVTADVLRELGEKAQDVCNNVLSHSRNLYNMFPEPIILDSDEEEISVIAKKPMKKLKEDSKITQSTMTKSKEEKKIKEPVPGGSRSIEQAQHAADIRLKKQISAQSLSNAGTTISNAKAKTKPICPKEDTQSVVVIDIKNDDDLFPVYQPGSSVHQTSKKKPKDRNSLELDDKFLIQWSDKQQKTGDNKVIDDPDVENIEVHEANEVEENNNKRRTTRHRGVEKSKSKVLNGAVPKSISDKNTRIKDDHVPSVEGVLSAGGSRSIEQAQYAADKILKKQISAQSLSNAGTTRSNAKAKNKPICPKKDTQSVVVIDNEDDDNLFPVYQPGSSVHQTTRKKKPKEKVRNFGKRQKTGDNKVIDDPDVENIEVHEANEVEENNNKRRTTRHRGVVKSESKVLNEAVLKSINNKNTIIKDGHGPSMKGELPSDLVSKVENVIFHPNKHSGGVSAKCLLTDQHEVGYLEVGADEVFNGRNANITFVVTEGTAKVVYLEKQQILSSGDMLHIKDDSGYQFESAGTDHVRFIYIKALIV